MEPIQPAATPQEQPLPCSPQPCAPQIHNDWEFNIGRAYLLLTATLVIPLYLSISLIAFSLGGLVV